jgi:GR25 family glycosyltransferase involved in LPS biosynthesis
MKFYVIRKKNDPLSEKLSDESVFSGLKYGIEVEKFDALYGEDGISFLKSNNLKPFLFNGKETKLTEEIQRKCVFASHYSLWLKCLNLDSPIGILEHDAVFIRHLPHDIESLFEDVLYLDFYSRPFLNGKITSGFFWKEPKKYKEMAENDIDITINPFYGYQKNRSNTLLEDIKSNYIRGVHGYIINPTGAKKLIDAAKNFGYLTSDAHINPLYAKIHVCEPSIVRINEFFCSEKNFRAHSHCEVDKNVRLV